MLKGFDNLKIYLRPHHGLCIILFSKIGHSETYAEIMSEHVELLNNNPQTEVVLGLTLDEMCGVCPHNNDSVCKKAVEVELSDSEILSYCGLEFGNVVKWEDLRKKLIDNIISKGLLHKTCPTCKYLPRCEEMALTM